MNARGWAVCNHKGKMGYATAFRRKDAIRLAELQTGLNWCYLRQKLGYTVRRVVVTVEERKDGE